MLITWHSGEVVRRSLQAESKAVIFCNGSKTRRSCLMVSIVYIRSRIVDKFFLKRFFLRRVPEIC